MMTANIISSGRGCGCAVFKFLECTGDFFNNDFDPEHFIHGNKTERRKRVRLTINFVLVQGK